MKVLMIAALAAVLLTGCNQPDEKYIGPKEGMSCKEAYKEMVNQNLCNQATAEG